MARAYHAYYRHVERSAAGERELSDTLRRCLTAEERAKLSMDAWEPSLLRFLLGAHDRLDRDSNG